MSGKILGTEKTLPANVTVPTPSEAPTHVTPQQGRLATTPTLAPVLSSPEGSLAGRHVLGARYEILGLVGAGGMGTVYRARDAELDEVVAVKMLRRDIVDQPGILDRFRQEVRLARRVTHRNVARTYDIGECSGEKFLTMEFIEGESLAGRLAREGGLPLGVVVAVAQAMCSGLDAAHAAGIVHRDLKPDNVLLERGGRVVITDFGVARALSDARQAVTVGLALGTPAYMAPEQVEGGTELDVRADVYALGAILYECLTGARAWSGENVWATASARLVNPPPDPRAVRPDVPESVAEVVLGCLARRREDRFSRAGDVARALAGLTMLSSGTRRPSVPPVASSAVAEPDAKTVAVVPFRNLGAPDDAYLVDGIGDDLVDALSMTPGLRVLARGAVLRAGGPERDARDIGRELRVQVVVEGSVRRVGTTLRVSARVVSVADGFQLWARRFDRTEREVFAASDELATAVADALTVKRSAAARAAPSDPRAVALYLRARHALHTGWRDDVTLAIALFEQALALAPDEARILAGYGRAQLRRFLFDTEAAGAEQAVRLSRDAAERALERDPASGEALAALALLKWTVGDAIGCARDLREALRLSATSADVLELHGRMLLEAGELGAAIARLEAAVAAEPSINAATGDLLRARVLSGDWSAYDAAIEGDPSAEARAPYWFQLARLTAWRRDPEVAAAFRAKVMRREFDLKPEILAILDLYAPDAPAEVVLAGIDGWGQVTGRGKRRPMFFKQLAAELAGFVGNHERALAAIEEGDAIGLMDITWLDRCPLLEGVRRHPRLPAVRERIAERAKQTLDVLEGQAP